MTEDIVTRLARRLYRKYVEKAGLNREYKESWYDNLIPSSQQYWIQQARDILCMVNEVTAPKLDADQVAWVVYRSPDCNSVGDTPEYNGDLGVKIGDQVFVLYKGSSLAYSGSGTYRPVEKREFGESIHPENKPDQYDWKKL